MSQRLQDLDVSNGHLESYRAGIFDSLWNCFWELERQDFRGAEIAPYKHWTGVGYLLEEIKSALKILFGIWLVL